MQPPDTRAREAQVVLAQNREELRSVFADAGARAGSGFPRSATFRWLTSHLNARSLASTALAAVLVRPGLVAQLLGGWLRRKARRQAAGSRLYN
jgi:hypothetical protein